MSDSTKKLVEEIENPLSEIYNFPLWWLGDTETEEDKEEESDEEGQEWEEEDELDGFRIE